MKAFITSHFSCCPLTWMIHSINMEHHKNIVHKKALKLVYNETPNLSFGELLVKGESGLAG